MEGCMKEEEELQFHRLWEKRQDELRGIIPVTGPPTTCKTELAEVIGRWAKCPTLCIQDFFSPRTTATTTTTTEANDTTKENAVATDKEVVQVQQHTFTALYKVASRHMEVSLNNTAVIKSRLSSTFELQHLFEFVTRINTRLCANYPILIIECHFTNKYIWEQHFERAREKEYDNDGDDFSWWYRPWSWEEDDKASRDYHSQSHHLVTQLHLHQQNHDIRVRRLVVDPLEDIISRSSSIYCLTPLPTDFTDAIKYLLTTPQHEIQLLLNINPQQHNYPTTIDYIAVELHDLRPHLFEKRVSARLAAANGRKTQTYCPGVDQCVFKLYNVDVDDNIGVCCGVCGEQVVHSSSASSAGCSSYYACRLWILTLHKPCAERLPFNALHFELGLALKAREYYHQLMPKKHACKSCSLDGGFNKDCGSCQLQTHLKCGLLPTIIHHNSHPPHFLSLLVTLQWFRCSACGERTWDFAYSCRPCGLYHHLGCALLPLQLLRHQHGGHQHVMRLLYSHHDTDEPDSNSDPEEEESYWCDICGKDMDPKAWCYSCQDCPYYSAHLKCARGYEYMRSNVKNSVFIPQTQSQLEAVMAEVSSVDSKTPPGNY